MNDILDIELIIKRSRYSFVYNIGVIFLTLSLVFVYVSCVYNYKTYFISKGVFKDECIELLVQLDDIKYVVDNNILKIDGVFYEYNVKEISENLYVDEFYNNYKYVYLKINNFSSINNYVYDVKLQKENKKIIEYIKDYL